MNLRFALLTALLGLATAPAPARAQEGPVLSSVSLADAASRAALRDLHGDGRLSLLVLGPDGISAHVPDAAGRYPAEPALQADWPSSASVGWSVADLDGNGRTEVVLLVDGKQLVTLGPGEDGRWVSTTRLEQPDGFLPRGIRRVNFLRDVDGDGRLDVVVPGAGRFLIHLQTAEGFAPALAVDFRARVITELGDPERLDSRFGEDVTIPWFSLRDVDGDGTVDLVSETADTVAVHLARPALARTPDWTLDLAALRAELPQRTSLDLDNLLGNIDPRLHWNTADLDGSPPHDLVLQQGGTFRVYLGGSHGPVLENPDQVLKASGNVLHFLLRDVNGDKHTDLQILRAQSLSLADALRLLVVPGAFEFDVFTYGGLRGAADVFERRPAARTTVALRIPALLGFIDDLEQLQERHKVRLEVPAQPADLRGAGRAADVVDLRDGKLLVHHAAVPEAFEMDPLARLARFDVDSLLEEYVIRDLDAMGDGGRKEIALADIEQLIVAPGHELRVAAGDRPADLSVDLPLPLDKATLHVRDLDGNGRDDVVITGLDGERRRVFIFVTGL